MGRTDITVDKKAFGSTMKNIVTSILILIFGLSAFGQDSLPTKKILIVATNINTLGGNTNGTFLMEIVYPFKYFIDKGYTVDIVTPKGGQVAIYDMGTATADMKKIQESDLFVTKTKNSLSPDKLKDTDYFAVYYPGGYGQFFDVIKDDRIALLTAKIYENGGVIGTAGHGAVSLTNIKLSNNKYLVEGKKITCFPWCAEISGMAVSNYGRLLPFNMEDVLTKRGANLIVCSKGKGNKECSQIIDGKNRIVTGAGAYDAQWVAQEMVNLLPLTKK